MRAAATGLALHVRWDGPPLEPTVLRAAADRAGHRGPGSIWSSPDAALLQMSRGPREPALGVARSGSLAAVFHGHLDNRAQLDREIPGRSGEGSRPPSALLLAAYRKWGLELVDRLRGDFALLLWDAERRRLLAARDPFGLKPLFYARAGASLVCASEVKQVLAELALAPEPNDLVVGEFLFGRMEEIGQTFYRGVNRLPPGHRLVATESGVRVDRYWAPQPSLGFASASAETVRAQFREALERAVLQRIAADSATCAQLSGGLDSASIVTLAGSLAERGAAPPLAATLSAVFPGLGCDETRGILAVGRRVPFPNIRFEPLATATEDLAPESLLQELAYLDSPMLDPQRGVFCRTAREMRERGAGTLLTGMGGDELTHEEELLPDLALEGRYLDLAREAWLGRTLSHNSFLALLISGLRVAAPEGLKILYRQLRPGWSPPDWAQPELTRTFLAGRQVPTPQLGLPSRVQEAVFRYVNSPDMIWALELMELRAARAGFEIRHPFLDRDLAELAMAIPLDLRLPHGRWKALLRTGLRDELPPEVTQARKVHFSAFTLGAIKAGQRALLALHSAENSWHCDRYVDRSVGLELLRKAASSSAAAGSAWRIHALNLWLGILSVFY